MAPLKFRSTRAQRDVDAINAAEEVNLIFSAGEGQEGCVKRAEFQKITSLLRGTVNLAGAPANRGSF
jgi:hypothetical protein